MKYILLLTFLFSTVSFGQTVSSMKADDSKITLSTKGGNSSTINNNQVFFRATTAASALPSNSPIDTEIVYIDTCGCFLDDGVNERWIVPYNGYYFVSLKIAANANSLGTSIRHNGATQVFNGVDSTNTGAITSIIKAYKGDTIQAFHTTGGSRNIVAGAENHDFSIHKIGGF